MADVTGVVTVNNHFHDGGCDVCVEWDGGSTDYTALGWLGNSFGITYTVGLGTSCWMRLKYGLISHNHDSGDNFNAGDSNVVYNLNMVQIDGTPSWDRIS